MQFHGCYGLLAALSKQTMQAIALYLQLEQQYAGYAKCLLNREQVYADGATCMHPFTMHAMSGCRLATHADCDL